MLPNINYNEKECHVFFNYNVIYKQNKSNNKQRVNKYEPS